MDIHWTLAGWQIELSARKYRNRRPIREAPILLGHALGHSSPVATLIDIILRRRLRAGIRLEVGVGVRSHHGITPNPK
jgi:hypothetical protein